MPQTVDERIVEMRIDNEQFERGAHTTMSTMQKLREATNFDDSVGSVNKLQNTFSGFDTSHMAAALSSVQTHFSALEIAGMRVISNLTDAIYNFTANTIKSFTIGSVAPGWEKFGEKTTSVSTLTAQGYELEKVNGLMEQLNWFTDETSYNFTDMVGNIAKFTATGQNLDESVTAMEGIALWAALSGQNATKASQAMYQLSQAMGKGALKYDDWRSIQNASMDTQEFRRQAVHAAEELGVLKEVAEGTWEVIGKNKQFDLSGLFSSDAMSRTLWFNSDVMMEVFNRYSKAVGEIQRYMDENNVDTASKAMEELEAAAAELAETAGITLDEAFQRLGYDIDEFSLKAFKAGQEARTWRDVVDSVKDAVSTGWMTTFEKIFGTAEDATKFWTKLANSFYDIFAEGGNIRNEVLDIAFGTGVVEEETKKASSASDGWANFENRIKSAGRTMEQFEEACRSVVDANGNTSFESLIKEYGSLEKAFQQGAISGETFQLVLQRLAESTEATVSDIDESTQSAGKSLEELKEVAMGVLRGDYGSGEDRRKMLEELGYNYDLIQGMAEIIYNNGQGYRGLTEELLRSEYPTFYAMLQQYGVSSKEAIDAMNGVLAESDQLLTDIQTNIIDVSGTTKDVVERVKGSDLFQGGLTNLVDSVSNIQNVWRAAVENIFGDAAERGAKLYNVLERFNKFTERIKKRTESLDGLQAFIERFFSKLRNVGTLAKLMVQSFKGVFDILSKIAKAFTDGFFGRRGVTGVTNFVSVLETKLGKALVSINSLFKDFLNFVEEHLPEIEEFAFKIGSAIDWVFVHFEKLVAEFSGLFSHIVVDALDGLGALFPGLQKFLSPISDFLREKLQIPRDDNGEEDYLETYKGFLDRIVFWTNSCIASIASTIFGQNYTDTLRRLELLYSTVQTLVKSIGQLFAKIAVDVLNILAILFPDFRDSADAAIAWLTDAFGESVDGAEKTLPRWSDIFSSISDSGFHTADLIAKLFGFDGLGKTIDDFKKKVSTIFEPITDFFLKASVGVLDLIGLVFPNFKERADDISDWLILTFGKVDEDGGRYLPGWIDVFGELGESVNNAFERISELFGWEGFEGFGTTIDEFKSKISNIFEPLVKSLSVVKTVFGYLWTGIQWVFDKLSSFGIGDILGVAVFAYVAYKIYDFIDGIKERLERLTSIFDVVTSIPEKIKSVFSKLSSGIKAATITAIAAAILMLAGALWILGTVNYDKAVIGVIGIGVIFGVIISAVGVFEKIKFTTLAKAAGFLLAVSAALLVASVALGALALAVAGFAAISHYFKEDAVYGLLLMLGSLAVVLTSLAVAAEVLGAKTLLLIPTAAALLVAAGALVVLALAMAAFAAISKYFGDDAATGLLLMLGTLAVVFGSLAVAVEVLGMKTLLLIPAAASLAIAAGALLMLALAMVAFAAISKYFGDDAATGLLLMLGTLAVVFGSLAVAVEVLGAKTLLLIPAAAALAIAGAALLVLALALAGFAAIVKHFKDDATAGLIFMAASLGILVVALMALGAAALPVLAGAAALLVGAAALAVFAVAVGVVSLVLPLLAVGLEALGDALESIIGNITNSLVIFVDGLSQMAASLGEGIASFVTSIVEALGNAVVVMGESIGEAVAALGEGIGSAISDIGTGWGEAIDALGSGIGSAIEDVLTGIGNGIGEIGEGVGEIVSALGEGVGSALSDIGTGWGEAIEALGSGVGSAISDVGSGAGKAISEVGEGIASAITDLIASVGKGIGEGLSGFSTGINDFSFSITGFGIAVKSLDDVKWTSTAVGIGEFAIAVNKLNKKSLATNIIELSAALQTSVVGLQSDFSGLGKKLSDWFGDGAKDELPSSMASVSQKAYEELKKSVDLDKQDYIASGTTGGKYWFDGYITEVVIMVPQMVADTVNGLSVEIFNRQEELRNLGRLMFQWQEEGYRSAADQHSPSRVMQQEMAYTIQGLVVGAEKNAKNAFNAMEAVGDGMMDAMHNSMSRLALAVDRDYDIQPKITPIVDLGPASRGASALSNMMNGGTIRSIAESYRSMEGLAISGATLNYTSQNAPVTSAIDGLSKKMDRFTKSLDEDRNFNVDIRVDQMAVRDESDIRAISKQLAKEVRVALRQKGTR